MSFARCEESEEGTMDLAKRTFVQEELEHIFKYIPSTKLLSFRQVSEESNEAAKTVLKKRRDIKLLLTTDNFDISLNWKFLQFLNDSPENVFVAPVLHIKNANKSTQDLEEGKTCISFEVIGEICKRLGNRGIIRKLILEDGKNAPHFTPDYVLTLFGLLPSLKTLETSELNLSPVTTLATSEQNSKLQLLSLKKINFRYESRSDVKEAGNFLKTILELSPNLEIITGWDFNKLNTIAMLRDTGRLSKIKEVILTQSTDLDILLQCKPKMVLNSLKIETIDKDVVDFKKLFAFLQQQAVNLKSFECDHNSLVPKSILTLPLLPVLKTLRFKPWDSGCLLSVNYGRQTSALKTLKICCTEDFHSWEEFISYEISSERPPCRSLEKLNLSVSGPTSQGMFDNWKNLFPNVKKLTVENPEEFDFDQANKCWPNLEELKLRIHLSYCKCDFDYKDLDEIVFGINPDPDYWKEKNIDWTDKDWWMKISEPEIKKTVANMKNLQKLDVIVKGYYGGFYLTDFAVYFGLRHMKNLREIAIITTYSAPEVKVDISTEAFNFLVKNLPELEKLSLGEQDWERGETLDT